MRTRPERPVKGVCFYCGDEGHYKKGCLRRLKDLRTFNEVETGNPED